MAVIYPFPIGVSSGVLSSLLSKDRLTEVLQQQQPARPAPRPKKTPPPPAPVVEKAPDSSPRISTYMRASRLDRRDPELVIQEISGCKSLLLEIIRRAAYDWVLYRSSTRLLNKKIAEQAYSWLFLEGPDHPDWRERQREGKHITGFAVICESLELDVEVVRGHIRRLTPKNVMSVGRPAEYRRRESQAASSTDEDVYSVSSSLVGYEELHNDPPDDT